MPALTKDQQRELFNKAMKEIELDLEVIESMVSESIKEDADRFVRQIRHNLKAVWMFKDHN